MDKFYYVEPLVEEIKLAVEQGFATTGILENPEKGDNIDM